MAMLSSAGHSAMRTVDFIMYCKAGHKMDLENIHVDPTNDRLVCRVCDRDRKQRQRNPQN